MSDDPRLQQPPIGPSGTLGVPLVKHVHPFRVTLVRVIAVQVVALVLLWLLQMRYAR